MVLVLAVCLQVGMLLLLSKSSKLSSVDAGPDKVDVMLIAAPPAPPDRPTPASRETKKRDRKATPRQVRQAIKIEPAPSYPLAPIPEAEMASAAEPMILGADSGIAERALQAAGRVDKELRTGASGVSTSSPDTPTARMRRAMEGAYRGGGNATAFARYVSGDGVSITRLTRGGRAVCYVSAQVNMSPAAAMSGRGGGGGAREVNCPPVDAGWSRQ